MSIEIKRIGLSNTTELEKVFSETVNSQFPEYSENVRNYFIQTIFPDESKKEKLRLGAYDGESLIGYLIAENPFGGVVYINWIALKAEYQKKGIGSQLLRALEKHVIELGVHSIQLQTDARNLPFYKKNGFEVIGLDTKGYFGTDNYILKKLIQEPKNIYS